MKHGKNPTVRQKKLLKSFGLNCANWLVVTEDNKEMKIIHRHTDTVRIIDINSKSGRVKKNEKNL